MIPHKWKRSAADNGTADPNLDVRPNRSANTILGSIRGLMASGAAARDDAIGELVASLGGSKTNVYSVATNEGLIDITTGINNVPAAITTPFLLRLSFDTTLAGSAANVPHLMVDNFDCGPILRHDGSALADGDLVKGVPVLVQGDMAAATDTKVTRVRVLDLTPSDVAALAGGAVTIQVLTGAGTYTPTTGAKYAIGIAIGGGASGGSGTTTNYANGGGGGAGGTDIDIILLSGVASIPYSAGMGGAAATGSGVSGNAGSDTILGPTSAPLLRATGGEGGIGGNGSASILGRPGVGMVGRIRLAGNPGHPGTGGGQAGNGGASLLGGAGLASLGGAIVSQPGRDGGGSGGGLTGTGGTSAQNSAPGGDGKIIMIEVH